MTNFPTIALLDRLAPGESHLPPSRRDIARVTVLVGGFRVLDTRDPNDNARARYQYMVMRDRLWSRRLPEDADPTTQDDPACPWTLCEPNPAGMFWRAAGLRAYPTTPQKARDGWAMPERSPWDEWAAVTGAPCPACGAPLAWAEAGRVPGYRICGRPTHPHHWLWRDDVLAPAERDA